MERTADTIRFCMCYKPLAFNISDVARSIYESHINQWMLSYLPAFPTRLNSLSLVSADPFTKMYYFYELP